MCKHEHKIFNSKYECMSRDELIAHQSAKLRDVVKHEYENVPLYRARMDEKGVKPGDIRTIEDLRYLPFIEKTDLRDEFPYGLLAVPREEIVRIHGSSGTTGKPIVSGYTRGDVEIWSEMMARTLTAAGCGQGDIVQVAYGFLSLIHI